ncbi:hypothetical protein [Pseudochrobactrum asaccharolyticum]|uniref:hypothetical protein n=1 Tax=Pseudochrobactrum asaccharolyticum TaxID=354351 RepID=UPI00404365EA
MRDLVSLLSGGQLQSLAGLDLVVGDYLRAVGTGVIGKVAGKNLDALAALTGENNRIPMFTGANAMSLLDANNFPLGKIATAYNWVINGNFPINQRGATSKAQPVGVYGYDRWKGHANGLEQVIEALPAGEYTLTWSGGGTGTFGSSTKASPIKATVSAGNRSVIVPASATKVSLVSGDATGADPWVNVERPYTLEFILSARYCYKPSSSYSHGLVYAGASLNNTAWLYTIQLPVPMRIAPSVTVLNEGSLVNIVAGSLNYTTAVDIVVVRCSVANAGWYRALSNSVLLDAEF